MAVVAGVGTRNVSRVLAGGRDAVVTGTATPDHLSVIDGHHGREDICAVAVFTDIRRQNVSRVLASCIRSVMATDTVAAYVYVVEIRG